MLIWHNFCLPLMFTALCLIGFPSSSCVLIGSIPDLRGRIFLSKFAIPTKYHELLKKNSFQKVVTISHDVTTNSILIGGGGSNQILRGRLRSKRTSHPVTTISHGRHVLLADW